MFLIVEVMAAGSSGCLAATGDGADLSWLQPTLERIHHGRSRERRDRWTHRSTPGPLPSNRMRRLLPCRRIPTVIV